MPTALAQLGRTAAPVPLADAVAFSGFLDLAPDPRGARGHRYRLSALVAAAAAASAAAVTAAAAGARTAAGSGREARQREHDDYCHRRELQSARPCLLAHERSPHSAVRDRPVSLQVPPRAAKASSSTEPSITLTLRTSDSPAGTDRMAPPSVVATCLPSASVNLTSNL